MSTTFDDDDAHAPCDPRTGWSTVSDAAEATGSIVEHVPPHSLGASKATPTPPGHAAVLAVMAIMGVLNGFFAGPSLIAITESLPRAVRSGGLGTLYAVAMATFGGSTQFVVKGLIEVTGSPLAPAWYLSAALAAGVVATLLIRETAPVKTGVADTV